MIESLHTGMKAKVNDGGGTSEAFNITNGVKQGCDTTPVVTLPLFHTPISNDGCSIPRQERGCLHPV